MSAPWNGDKLLSRLQEAQERSGHLRSLPGPALRPEGEEVVMGAGRNVKEGGGLGWAGDTCLPETWPYCLDSRPLCTPVTCVYYNSMKLCEGTT